MLVAFTNNNNDNEVLKCNQEDLKLDDKIPRKLINDLHKNDTSWTFHGQKKEIKQMFRIEEIL